MLDTLDHWMRERFKALSDTFWFIPASVSLFGPVLAIIFLTIDSMGISERLNGPLLFHGGVSAASSLLSTIAGSLITVAGLAFSVTIVALQLVSSQYTPRALRGFLQDRVTQYVAGGFFAIFSYALIVLSMVLEPTPPARVLSPGLVLLSPLVSVFWGWHSYCSSYITPDVSFRFPTLQHAQRSKRCRQSISSIRMQ